MAKRKVVMVDVGQMVGEAVTEPEKDTLEDSSDKAMEEAVRDFAEGERVVKLYRYQGPLGGRPRLLCGLAREDFNDVFVQERFGGGEYFGRWRNKRGLYTKFNFDIEGPPKEEPERERVQQRNDEEREPYPYLSQPAQPAGEESRSSQIGMIDVLRMMAETRKEAREEMRVMLEMMRPMQSAPDATEKVFSLVEKLAPLISQGGNGEGASGNPWLFALSQLKDPIMKAIDTIHTAVVKGSQPQQPAQRSPQAVIPPASPIGQVTPGATVEPQQHPVTMNPEQLQPTEGEMLADSFKAYIPMMVKAADEKQDPGIYCDLVLANVPGFLYNRVRDWLVKPGCLDDLAKHAPIISADRNQRLWWEALQGMLVSALNEEIGDHGPGVQSQSNSDPSTSGSTDSASLPR